MTDPPEIRREVIRALFDASLDAHLPLPTNGEIMEATGYPRNLVVTTAAGLAANGAIPDRKAGVNKARREPRTARPAPAAVFFRTCQWPIGDPRNADFKFCGKAAAEGRPYCAAHVKRAYARLQRIDAEDAA